MGYKAAVQILKQAEDLKIKVLRKCDLLADAQAWTDQQKLQGIYHQALVLDLEYALDKKVEQDLWNVGFKNHISVLQELARDKKNFRRSECQALLTWCLEAASGFYLTLLQELCNIFDIDLPFRRRGNVFGQVNSQNQLILPQSSSCLYICQYCLVHLGDIARYRNQRKEAECFYKQAILVSPTSGQPYNQLALLEASRGDKLSTVFYYIRGIAVKNPFPAASTNLLSTLNSTVDKESPLEKIQTKITVNEFIQIFLCTQAFLHMATDLAQADICVKSLNTTMTALVATQSFNSDKLVKITAINLYALKHVTSYTKNLNELTKDEILARKYILDLLAGSLSAFLVPVHTLKNDETLLDYYALPAVKILMDWIEKEPDLLKEDVFANRLQIWPSLCKLLNNIEPYLKSFDHEKYKMSPLPEDKVLEGFRPLSGSFEKIDFKNEEILDDKVAKLVRAQRMIDFGLFITELDINNSKLIIRSLNEGNVNFEPGCIQPDPTDALLEEMKSFNITDILSRNQIKNFERKAGILKPQGSLEKSREERELLSGEPATNLLDLNPGILPSNKKEIMKNKRSKQNVALQSIIKKLEENNKQVKFNVEDVDKGPREINSKHLNNPSMNQFPVRTQSFNQNHPAFPVPNNPPPQDYLSSLRNVSKPMNNFGFPPPNKMEELKSGPFGVDPQLMFGGNPPPFRPPYRNNVPPFQNNMQFPPPNFGMKMEPPEPPHNWWPNSPQNNYQQRPENYHNFPHFQRNLHYQPQASTSSDFTNKSSTNQAGGDMFGGWNHFPRPNFLNEFDNNAISMRQAMLKEATTTSAPLMRQMNNEGFNPNPASSPGYSLFNTNTWTPDLGLRSSNKPQDNAQHSLLTGPRSLQQLLEQQNQKND